MKFTTKQRNFLIAPSLSHLFVYSHAMFHILAEERKWGVWLVRQCNEVPPEPKSIVTVQRRKTKLPALSTKHHVQPSQVLRPTSIRSRAGNLSMSSLASPSSPSLSAHANGGIPVNHCLYSNIWDIHPPSSFVCVQLNIVAHRLNNPFGVSLDQTPYWTYIMPLDIHLKTMKQTMYLHSERYHLNPTWGKDEESWE